jgi:REP element-mobilizing transposase RayT
MANQVHLVLHPNHPLSDVMRWRKTATAVRSNSVLDRAGSPFWQREYFDRWIRSEKELAATVRYGERNPVTAGLVAQREAWPWSSASGL